jgi:RNase H-fold protein (predicted Holliday junction resolvase)
MPTYNIEDTTTGTVTTEMLTISEMEQLLKDNPHKRLVLGFPKIVSGVDSKRNKPPEAFRDLLKNIKSHNRGSTMNTW